MTHSRDSILTPLLVFLCIPNTELLLMVALKISNGYCMVYCFLEVEKLCLDLCARNLSELGRTEGMRESKRCKLVKMERSEKE